MKIFALIAFASIPLFLTACTPKIQLETPKEGITINMNVVVDHKIKIEMDEKTGKVIEKKD